MHQLNDYISSLHKRNKQNERQSSQLAGRLKSRVVTGQSSTLASSIWAAKKTVKTAVLCVNNVDLACNEDDIRAYVSSLGAEVFTCFKANPRRRPNESAKDVKDRRAFRLCVNAGNLVRLLNPDAWPYSIRVSKWLFSLTETNFLGACLKGVFSKVCGPISVKCSGFVEMDTLSNVASAIPHYLDVY